MLVTPSAWTKQPWKNGRGVTNEIWRWSDPARAAGDYDLRLSVALIDGAQEFSLFPGYWRALVPLDESALTLGGAPLLRRHVYAFSGDVATRPNGSGTTRDLNVISRVARARAEVTIGVAQPSSSAPHVAVFAFDSVTLRDPRGAEHALAALDTWIALDAHAAFTASSPVVWIRF